MPNKFKYSKWLADYEAGPKWPERMAVVGVLWEDATKCEEVADSGTLNAFTPGVLMRASKKEVVVAHEVFDDKSERDCTTIPRKMIKNITTLGQIDF